MYLQPGEYKYITNDKVLFDNYEEIIEDDDFNDDDVEITNGLGIISEFERIGSIAKVFDFDDEKLKEI